MKPEDKYGMLTPIQPTSKRYNNEVVWEFRCDCGRIVHRSLCHVKRNTKLGYVCSCGKHKTKNKSEKCSENISHLMQDGTNITLIKKRDAYATNKLGVKGVCYDSARNKYIAQIKFQGKYYFLGRYDTIEEAAEAYQNKRKEILEQYDN